MLREHRHVNELIDNQCNLLIKQFRSLVPSCWFQALFHIFRIFPKKVRPFFFLVFATAPGSLSDEVQSASHNLADSYAAHLERRASFPSIHILHIVVLSFNQNIRHTLMRATKATATKSEMTESKRKRKAIPHPHIQQITKGIYTKFVRTKMKILRREWISLNLMILHKTFCD